MSHFYQKKILSIKIKVSEENEASSVRSLSLQWKKFSKYSLSFSTLFHLFPFFVFEPNDVLSSLSSVY